ncbi:hypothetical protein N7448_008533 [Penicillium atrosanguineum]|uniref:Uncharacterized protein n=1 Tax=Penicillium atrosanguineum TaxID=1132637 RepID=A0A9W9GRR8_9EURO|nr:uncharacterized protein N7443_000451 [Penicillium atrosanguineum]KAJ5127754.1 hypothetical protein N7448_008533 [Penicillium atrosanguineum]KAJ5313567.1 hypothetical protein N7443_000451 [Penicillium atrosanguineum]KAJ5330741.1 hypothetical protein N7476_000524 [Penicillium atrosanguineum]
MNFLLLLFLVFFAPLLLFTAWLAASSCLGNGFRLRGFSARPGMAYGQSYLRTMANSGPALSEQIEMDDMLAEPGTHRHFDEEEEY